VAEYQKLRKGLEGSVGRLKPTSSPEKIERYQHEFARKIREARHEAARGDIFSEPIAAEFRRLIAMAMKGQRATRIEKSLKHAEPVRMPRLRINHPYPEHVPLQSTPPTLLQNLPQLPPDIEYRIVAQDLILLDGKANMIIDLIPNAIPIQLP
jgi:hypothetical protein